MSRQSGRRPNAAVRPSSAVSAECWAGSTQIPGLGPHPPAAGLACPPADRSRTGSRTDTALAAPAPAPAAAAAAACDCGGGTSGTNRVNVTRCRISAPSALLTPPTAHERRPLYPLGPTAERVPAHASRPPSHAAASRLPP